MLKDIVLSQGSVEKVLLIVKGLKTTEGKQATTQVMAANAAPFLSDYPACHAPCLNMQRQEDH